MANSVYSFTFLKGKISLIFPYPPFRLLILVCLIVGGPPGWLSGISHAYEVITVTDGATISGHVTLSGSAPPPQLFNVKMGSYPDHCRPIANAEGNVVLPRARVSSTNHIADVVVFLQEIEKGKAAASDGPVLTVNRCQFDHFVMAGMDGESLHIQMNDSVLHPLRGWEMLHEGRIPLFHFPDLPEGTEQATTLTTRRSGIVKIECDQHRFMQTWILVPLNPYFSVTDLQGHFLIDHIPPGTYTLSAWHPILGYLDTSITVKPQEHLTDLSFAFEPPPS